MSANMADSIVQASDGPALPTVTAVLPAFNEAAVISDVVTRTDAALRSAGVPHWEIVVVDDGSSDDTGAQALAGGAPPVRVVRHEVNRGYGAALRTGFDAATQEAVWLMDSDGQFDPADISLLLHRWAPRTAVFGYRLHRQDPMMRRWNHAAFFSVVRVVSGPLVRDVNCAFKLFPREIGQGLHADGAIISTELVLRARRLEYHIVEVGVPHYPRRAGTPTGANPRVVARAFAELWRMRRQHWVDDVSTGARDDP